MVSSDNAERVDDTDGDGFKEGDYYFGGEDDGAMTVGWLQMDITYDEATNDYEIAPVFNDDEDQTVGSISKLMVKRLRQKMAITRKKRQSMVRSMLLISMAQCCRVVIG